MKKAERQKLFEMFNGHCAYCGCKLEKGWHADHIEPLQRGEKYIHEYGRFRKEKYISNPENERADNYFPACQGCNIQKNSFTIEEFRRNIKRFVQSLNRYNNQYKFAKKYGLVKETEIEVVFHFEKT